MCVAACFIWNVLAWLQLNMLWRRSPGCLLRAGQYWGCDFEHVIFGSCLGCHMYGSGKAGHQAAEGW